VTMYTKIPSRVIDLISLSFIYLRVIWRYCVRSRVPRPWKKIFICILQLSPYSLSMHNYSLSMLVIFDIYYYFLIHIHIYMCVRVHTNIRFYVTVLCVYIYVRVYVCVCAHTYICITMMFYSLLLLLTYYTCRRNARNWLPGSDPPN